MVRLPLLEILLTAVWSKVGGARLKPSITSPLAKSQVCHPGEKVPGLSLEPAGHISSNDVTAGFETEKLRS